MKDAMREGGCQEVAEACYSLAQLYGSSRPELAAGVLSAFARYIHWIDIGLVANDRWVAARPELRPCRPQLGPPQLHTYSCKAHTVCRSSRVPNSPHAGH